MNILITLKLPKRCVCLDLFKKFTKYVKNKLNFRYVTEIFCEKCLKELSEQNEEILLTIDIYILCGITNYLLGSMPQLYPRN